MSNHSVQFFKDAFEWMEFEEKNNNFQMGNICTVKARSHLPTDVSQRVLDLVSTTGQERSVSTQICCHATLYYNSTVVVLLWK